jgi:hypothetical protein
MHVPEPKELLPSRDDTTGEVCGTKQHNSLSGQRVRCFESLFPVVASTRGHIYDPWLRPGIKD